MFVIQAVGNQLNSRPLGAGIFGDAPVSGELVLREPGERMGRLNCVGWGRQGYGKWDPRWQ